MAASDDHFNYAIVEQLGMKFVISRTPEKDTLARFVELWNEQGVKNVVRICSANMYDSESLKEQGITVHEMEFKDGTNPSSELIRRWMDLVNTVFPKKGAAPPEAGTAIAVHCVAGMGRAPMMVIIALIERGMDNKEAIKRVREIRGKCLNDKQVPFVISYKPHKDCIIM